MPPSIPVPTTGAQAPQLLELDTGSRIVRIFGITYDLGFFEAVAESRVGTSFIITAKDDKSVTLRQADSPAQAVLPPDLLMATPQHEPLPFPEPSHER